MTMHPFTDKAAQFHVGLRVVIIVGGVLLLVALEFIVALALIIITIFKRLRHG